MKENKFSKDVVKQLKSQAAFDMNFHGHRMQKSGWPDLQVIHRKWKGFLELKCEKYEASSLQRIIAAKIELRGVPIYVLRCVEVDPTGGHWDIGHPKYEFFLENFQGNVIKPFCDLGSLLDVLVGLKNEKEKNNESI